MSAPKWTSGPWRLEEDVRHLRIVDADGSIVLEQPRFAYATHHKTLQDVRELRGWLYASGTPRHMREAARQVALDGNARQLEVMRQCAASPDVCAALEFQSALVEALANCRKAGGVHIYDVDGEALFVNLLRTLEAARAALAKARGGQS